MAQEATQRVTVVGGTGVLGRRVVAQLLAAGHQVIAPARSEQAADRLPAGVGVVGDPWDQGFLRRAMDGSDAVMMLATAIPTGSAAARAGAWRTNSDIRSRLAPMVARTARAAGVRRFVQESVMFVYAGAGARPVAEDGHLAPGPPAVACLAAELGAASFAQGRTDASSVVLRFALFVAGDSGQTQDALALADRAGAMVFGDLRGYTAFVHADDAAAAVVRALDPPPGTYNVGAEPVTKQQWLATMSEVAGRTVHPPPGLLRQGLPRLVTTVDTLGRSIRLDSGLLRSHGWAPRYPTARDVWQAAAAEPRMGRS